MEQFTADRVAGWVAVRAHAPATRVSLHVNGSEIAATWASEPNGLNNWGEVRPFRFWLHELWDWVRTGDELTVCYESTPLPIVRHGMLVRPGADGTHTAAELIAKLADGYLFGQKGELQLSKKVDTEWQRGVLGLFAEVRRLMHTWFGYETFFVYGTLLGAVREGGFIGHDLDLDSAYVSAHSDGAAAAAELRDIALRLIDAGYRVESFLTHLHIVDRAGTRIDLFHLYFDDAGKLGFPFGVAGPGRMTKQEWRGCHEVDFAGGRAMVPVLAERMVEHMYGLDWRDPKPGFMWYLDRVDRAHDGIMPADMVEQIRWADHYAHTPALPPSPFACALLDRADLPGLVVDLGCGDGRDSVAFAEAGRRVLALERAHTAVALAADRLAGFAGAQVRALDLGDPVALDAALAPVLGGDPVLFHLRFLLHAIPGEVAESVLGVLCERLRPGDVVTAEFRSSADEDRPKAREHAYRRFVDADAMVTRLTDGLGCTLVQRLDGTGLSTIAGEDPELCRVIARR